MNKISLAQRRNPSRIYRVEQGPFSLEPVSNLLQKVIFAAAQKSLRAASGIIARVRVCACVFLCLIWCWNSSLCTWLCARLQNNSWPLQIWNPISMCSLGSCSFPHPASTEHAFLYIAWEEKKQQKKTIWDIFRYELISWTQPAKVASASAQLHCCHFFLNVEIYVVLNSGRIMLWSSIPQAEFISYTRGKLYCSSCMFDMFLVLFWAFSCWWISLPSKRNNWGIKVSSQLTQICSKKDC